MAVVEVLVNMVPRARYEAAFTVKDGETGAPVSGATVSCEGLSGVTGGEGKVTLRPFRAGSHDFTVTAADYENYSGAFSAG